MTWHELQLQRQLKNSKQMRAIGEKWTSLLQSEIKTEQDAIFLMQEQKRLSIINQTYRDTLHRLSTYKAKQHHEQN